MVKNGELDIKGVLSGAVADQRRHRKVILHGISH